MSDGDAPEQTLDREDVLALLEDALEESHRKVTSGRVYDRDNELTRIKWIRSLAYVANQWSGVRDDRDLDRLADVVEELEERVDDGDAVPGFGNGNGTSEIFTSK